MASCALASSTAMRNGRWIEPKEHLAGIHLLIVLDVDFDDPAGNIGADRDPRRLHIGVVGRHVASAGQVPIAAPRASTTIGPASISGSRNLWRNGRRRPRTAGAALERRPQRADRRRVVFGGSGQCRPPTGDSSASALGCGARTSSSRSARSGRQRRHALRKIGVYPPQQLDQLLSFVSRKGRQRTRHGSRSRDPGCEPGSAGPCRSERGGGRGGRRAAAAARSSRPPPFGRSAAPRSSA